MSATPSPTVSLAELGDRFDLPSGGWIQLRPLADLRSKHRQQVAATIPRHGMTPVDVLLMQRKVAEVMIVGWHLPYEADAVLPSQNPELLGELSVRDENLLYKKLEPALALINPDSVDPADHANPDSPTEPAGDSTPA